MRIRRSLITLALAATTLIMAQATFAASKTKAADGEAKLKARGAAASAAKSKTVTKSEVLKNLKDIYPGYRGVTLPAEKHQLLNIERGDRVDVLVTFKAVMGPTGKKKEKQAIEMVTATILQNVIVFNVDKHNGIVELVLNPNEAQYAVLSIEEGKIWIIRRGEGDTEMHPLEMATFRKLFR